IPRRARSGLLRSRVPRDRKRRAGARASPRRRPGHPAPPDRRRLVLSSLAPVEREGALPELAKVHWRRRADEGSLRRTGRLWTLSTVAHTLPFLAGAMVLGLTGPVLIPFALLCL